jgi:hypothetical protein
MLTHYVLSRTKILVRGGFYNLAVQSLLPDKPMTDPFQHSLWSYHDCQLRFAEILKTAVANQQRVSHRKRDAGLRRMVESGKQSAKRF